MRLLTLVFLGYACAAPNAAPAPISGAPDVVDSVLPVESPDDASLIAVSRGLTNALQPMS